MKSVLLFLGFLIMLPAVLDAQPVDGRVPLDGTWLFAADSLKRGVEHQWHRASLDRSRWQPVPVPRFWESYPGCASYDGWGWFATSFRAPRSSEPMTLYFAGVDDDAVVWLNDVEVGNHSGYSEPFALDVTQAMRDGENTLVVLVKDNAGGGGVYKPVTLIPTRLADELLKSELYGTPARSSAGWVRDAVIYSVYLRSFSPEGNFAGLERRLPELKKRGITVLWLLPIHPVGLQKRKGTRGSPYAVQDYYGVNPEFGTLADFRRLVSAAHRLGMHVIIDLVANHTSWDSKLMAEHPDWFTRDSSGAVVSPNPDWSDVADLNYDNPALHRYMIRMMVWWVREVGIDGFRCDVAEMVPLDFWEEARRALDRIRPVMMLAEGTLPVHHRRAFDVTYAWNLYDLLDPLLRGVQPASALDDLLKREQLQFPTGALRMRFVTNHDKNVWDAPAVEKFGKDGIRLAAVLVSTLPGIPMLYNGEEVANDRRLDLFERVPIDWSASRAADSLYTMLFRLRAQHPALRRGAMVKLSSAGDSLLYVFARTLGKDRVIVAVNFSKAPQQVRYALPRTIEEHRRFREAVTDDVVETTDGTISLRLPARGFRILE